MTFVSKYDFKLMLCLRSHFQRPPAVQHYIKTNIQMCCINKCPNIWISVIVYKKSNTEWKSNIINITMQDNILYISLSFW